MDCCRVSESAVRASEAPEDEHMDQISRGLASLSVPHVFFTEHCQAECNAKPNTSAVVETPVVTKAAQRCCRTSDEAACTSQQEIDQQQAGSTSWSRAFCASGRCSASTRMRRNSGGATVRLLSIHPNMPSTMQRDSWSLSEFCFTKKLASGYASQVFLATCKRSCQQVALKVYHMAKLPLLSRHQVYREVRLHSSLQHPHIIQLHAAFQEGSYVVLVQEYAEGGDLFSFLQKHHRCMTEQRAVDMVIRPLLLALRCMQEAGVVHRDIKLENILLTKDRQVKLADFGLAINVNEEPAVTRAGTLDYMAPEVLRCPTKTFPEENKANPFIQYGSAVDVWSVGVLAYELMAGRSPFTGTTIAETEHNVVNGTLEYCSNMSECYRAFICQALKKRPQERCTVKQMLHSPWGKMAPSPKPVAVSAASAHIASYTAALKKSSMHLAATLRSAPNWLQAQQVPPEPAVRMVDRHSCMMGVETSDDSCMIGVEKSDSCALEIRVAPYGP